MKIKEVTVYKKYKIGMPHYSSMEAMAGMTVEVGEKEKVNWEAIWDDINQQIQMQCGNIDPSWIRGIQEKAVKEFTKEK